MARRITHNAEYVALPSLTVEVRHAPGYADDGRVTIWNSRDAGSPIGPDEGINGHKGTWTTLHAVYYDPTPSVTPIDGTETP